MSDAVALKALDEAIGPAPWYWKTLKPITGRPGKQFVWRLGDYGTGRRYPLLEDARGELKFVAHTHLRAFPVPPNLFGAWFPAFSDTEPRTLSEVRVLCFNPDELPSISGPTQSSGRVYYSAGAAPVSQFMIPTGIPRGDNSLAIPNQLNSIDELLIVSNHTGGEASTAIYAVYPQRGKVEVFPQIWFKGFDEGYQWIARVTRHPVTRVLIGDGARIGRFELTEDGCHLARWIVW